jgi:predicted SAM-dependent methyltransferase
MVSRQLKAWYYRMACGPMKVNAWFYRRFRAPRSGNVKVHLGPGRQNYLDGWINLDANILTARVDVWANILDGLPFPDGTVDAVYSHHVIEHLPDSFLSAHFAEMWRCLKPGGVIRIGVPNGDAAIERFLQNDHEWFDDFPDRRTSIGGRFVNFAFCRGEHLTLLTASYLTELAHGAGFGRLRFCNPMIETHSPEWIDRKLLQREFESNSETPHTLILEAVKPDSRTASAADPMKPVWRRKGIRTARRRRPLFASDAR